MAEFFSKLSTPDEIHTVVVFQKLLSSFVPDNFNPVAEQRIMKLRNNSWKRQYFFFKKKERGWTSKLFCVLSFSKIVVCSLMVGFVYVSWSGCCFLRGYNNPRVFDQSEHTY